MNNHAPASRDAFAIPEIIRNIIHYQSTKDIYNSLCLSHLWCEEALDALWNNLWSVFPLLELVGPLVHDPVQGLFIFPTGTPEADLARFRYYSQRVTSISYHVSSQRRSRRTSRISNDAFLQIFGQAEPAHLFPRLHRISWEDPSLQNSAAQASFLIVPTLTSLSIRIPLYTADARSASDAALRIFTRCTAIGVRLDELRLRFAENKVDVEASRQLREFLESQTRLCTVELWTSGFSPELERTLGGVVIPRLRSLLIRPWDLHWKFNPTVTRLGLEARTLVDLELQIERGVLCTTEDIQFLSTSCPSLRKLVLCEDHDADWDKTLPHHATPLSHLAVFSQALPNLEVLILDFSCGSADIPDAVGSNWNYPSLRILGIGKSRINADQSHRVAEFLATICSPGIHIFYQKLWSIWDDEDSMERLRVEAIWDRTIMRVHHIHDSTKPWDRDPAPLSRPFSGTCWILALVLAAVAACVAYTWRTPSPEIIICEDAVDF